MHHKHLSWIKLKSKSYFAQFRTGFGMFSLKYTWNQYFGSVWIVTVLLWVWISGSRERLGNGTRLERVGESNEVRAREVLVAWNRCKRQRLRAVTVWIRKKDVSGNLNVIEDNAYGACLSSLLLWLETSRRHRPWKHGHEWGLWSYFT